MFDTIIVPCYDLIVDNNDNKTKHEERFIMTANQKWAERFFEEKDLPYKAFEIEHDEQTHFIDNEFVIELITQHTGEKELFEIIHIIRKIDFANGDVNHFLEHLAEGYVKSQY
jgi:hypothetical protein